MRTNMKHKRQRGLFALIFTLAILCTTQAFALSVGTFNIEYFSVSGKKAYSPDDCAALAQTIRKSGVDLLALQEIRGDADMRYFVTKYLPGWSYSGNDTGSRQDLYFLWRNDAVAPAEKSWAPSWLRSIFEALGLSNLVNDQKTYGEGMAFRFNGRKSRLYDRPPLIRTFTDLKSGRSLTLVNVHLKSQSTRGKKNKKLARQYNNAKRQAQIRGLNALVQSLEGPVLILGDFNQEDPPGLAFPLLSLPEGSYSYDDRKSRLDFIGYHGLHPDPKWHIREVETAIPNRSSKRSQSPDHDMVILDMMGISKNSHP